MLHIYRQVTALRRYRTVVLAKERQHPDRFPFDDVELLPRPRSNFIRRFYLKYIRRAPSIFYRGEFQVLQKALRRADARLMHIYFGHTGVHLLPFIEAWDGRCVVSFHGADVMLRPHQSEYEGRLRALLEKIPLVLARSESLCERLIALGCPPGKIRLNRTGIPLELFPLHERSPVEMGRWQFVQACRLIPKKGLRTALRAFAIFQKTNPAARFVIAGEGPMQPELESFVRELGLGESVEFRGFLDQPSLLELYRNSHVFLHPSEMTSDQNQEGIPNSMLEAMATGLPVVATLHGGIPEAVSEGKTGLLVPERDHEQLFRAMTEITATPARAFEMGRAAAAFVRAEFEQGEQIAKLESYYDEAAAPAR